MVEPAYSDERAEAFRAYMCLYGYKAAIDRCDWVEVRRAHALEHRPGNWCCVAQCDDGQTAITVADALQNFMRTGLIGDDFHTRTRLVGEKGA